LASTRAACVRSSTASPPLPIALLDCVPRGHCFRERLRHAHPASTAALDCQAPCSDTICENREDLFGEAGSPERIRVQKRVSYWKSFPERYYFLRAELGIRTASAKKRKPPSQRVKVPVSPHLKQEPTSPRPKNPSGANLSSGERRRCQREEPNNDRNTDHDEHFHLRFAELKLNTSSRFSIENNLAVDAETKARIRGMYKV
jgi:hypothetical protein